MKKIILFIITFFLFSQTVSAKVVSFYVSCKIPKGSLKTVKIDDIKYKKFSLKDKQKGNCSRDRMERSGAPYWERVELLQRGKINKKKINEITFKIKILEGMVEDREAFFQLENLNDKRGYPSFTLKFDETYLNIEYLKCIKCTSAKYLNLGVKSEQLRNFNIKSTNYYNKWINFKVIMSKMDNKGMGNIKTFVDGKLIFDVEVFYIKNERLKIKQDLYRPGKLSSPNKTTTILYSPIELNSYK